MEKVIDFTKVMELDRVYQWMVNTMPEPNIVTSGDQVLCTISNREGIKVYTSRILVTQNGWLHTTCRTNELHVYEKPRREELFRVMRKEIEFAYKIYLNKGKPIGENK